MASPTSPDGEAPKTEFPEFSLVLGGPLFQLLRRARMSGAVLELVRRRVVTLSMIAWLPLLVLSALEGNLFGTKVAVPFLREVEVHVRFLVALPLLVAAELLVHQRMRFVVTQFRERQLIPEKFSAQFEAAIASAYRLRNSTIAELLLIAFVFVVGISVVFRQYTALATPTWYGIPTSAGIELSISGRWFAYVSLPLFQFLLLRWYFRIFVWARFLWQVSRIELHLYPMHPDRVGGLGFLPATAHAFVPLAAAHGALVAGMIADRIFYQGAALPDFKAHVAVALVFVLSFVFAPLLPFAPRLAEAKRRALREYGTLAERYVHEFEARWLRGGASPDEPFVGSADIQSLADMGNSFEVVRSMRIVLVTRDSILQLAVATLAPIVPLALTMMSLEELLKTLVVTIL